jgi:hypothetical protein
MKYTKFIDCDPSVGSSDLDAAEITMGISLPPDLRQHYLKYNGGRPVKTCYPFGAELYEVRWFYPIKHGDPESTLEATYRRVSKVLPIRMIPFTDDSGGNLYCYSTAGPTMHSICYWDHEQYNTPNHGVTVLAPSLQAFLEGLVKDPDI